MTRVLLTGATGVLGTELRPRLRSAGFEVRAASREADRREAAGWASGVLASEASEGSAERSSAGEAASRETDRREVSERAPGDDSADGDSAVEWVELDLEAGTGIRTATDGVDVVVHAASDPRGDHEAVDVDGTRRLLDAAAALDVEHFLYVSIVGIDDIPYSYYEHKLEAERAVEASRVPSTVVRSTQFFPFVASILATVRRLPVWPLPTDVRLPLPGEAAAAFRTGAATCPDRAVGTRTWGEWLDAQDGVPGADAY